MDEMDTDGIVSEDEVEDLTRERGESNNVSKDSEQLEEYRERC